MKKLLLFLIFIPTIQFSKAQTPAGFGLKVLQVETGKTALDYLLIQPIVCILTEEPQEQ